MMPNKVETAVQWFRMSCAVFAGFSAHGHSIYREKSEQRWYISFFNYQLLRIEWLLLIQALTTSQNNVSASI